MKFSLRVTALLVAFLLFISIPAVAAAAEDSGLVYGIGFVKADGLNLRAGPGTDTKILGYAVRNECVVVLDVQGGWCHVLYDLQEGYMSADYLSVSAVENAELGYGSVCGSVVNLRSGPGVDCSRVAQASAGEKCYIVGLNNGWYKVLYNDTLCYIRSDYLTLTEIPYENRASSNSPKYYRGGTSIGQVPSSGSAAAAGTPGYGASVSGDAIVAKAKEYLGTPYVYGGAGPSGFDCSGLVYYVLSCLNVSAGRTPTEQYTMGSPVLRAELRPGDLVFFSGSGSVATHVGIYVGEGQFIHAPNSRSVVSYGDLTSGYWSEHYFGARRI